MHFQIASWKEMSFQSFSMSISPSSLVVYIPYLAKLLKWIFAHVSLNKAVFFPRLRNNCKYCAWAGEIPLFPFFSLTFLDCKIVECFWNTACIHRYLQLKGNHYGVAFYINCIRMYKPTNGLQAPLNVLCFTVCTCCQCLLLGQEEILCSNPPPRLEAALPLSAAKTTVLAAAPFCEPRLMTCSVGQEDTGKQSMGCSLLEPQAAALFQFSGDLQPCHCCCPPCWTPGDALWDVLKNPSSTCLLAIVLMFCRNVGLERMWNSITFKIPSMGQSLWALVGQKFLRSVLKAMLCSKSLGKVPHACTPTYRSHFPCFLKTKKVMDRATCYCRLSHSQNYLGCD